VTINRSFDRYLFTWNHEDDSRTWITPDLTISFKLKKDGTIQVQDKTTCLQPGFSFADFQLAKVGL
jgi:hypothetical protein